MKRATTWADGGVRSEKSVVEEEKEKKDAGGRTKSGRHGRPKKPREA